MVWRGGRGGRGRQVDGVGLAVGALRAAAQFGRQPRARGRRHALRLADPAPPLTRATRPGIPTFNTNKNKTPTPPT